MPLQHVRAFARYLDGPRRAECVVYVKEPFGGPQQVLDYLGRYTHRVAISNNRLIDIADGQVTFRWKDYRHKSARREMQLDASELIRHFPLRRRQSRLVIFIFPRCEARNPQRSSLPFIGQASPHKFHQFTGDFGKIVLSYD